MSCFAIEIYPDKDTSDVLCNLWQRFYSAKLVTPLCESRGYVPHISLLVANELDVGKALPIVKEFAEQTSPINVVFSHFGMFHVEGTSIWLGPTYSDELRELHRNINLMMKPLSADWWSYYKPEVWVPHCGLIANHPFENCIKALEICKDFQLPLSATFQRVTLVDFIKGEEFCLEPLKG